LPNMKGQRQIGVGFNRRLTTSNFEIFHAS